MTELHVKMAPSHLWDAEFAKLRERFPDATDGVLFCINKLQLNPTATLKDFKHEAVLHGLRVTGASFHSARVMLGLTERKARQASDDGNGWERAEKRLCKEFPDATQGILFCIYKIRQDPSLRVPDFRDEAAEHGVKLGGRSLHSARTLLGLESARQIPSSIDSNGSSLEQQLHETLAQMQEQANAESARLREAIRTAIDVLGRALVRRS